jgi:hypothetical protein
VKTGSGTGSGSDKTSKYYTASIIDGKRKYKVYNGEVKRVPKKGRGGGKQLGGAPEDAMVGWNPQDRRRPYAPSGPPVSRPFVRSKVIRQPTKVQRASPQNAQRKTSSAKSFNDNFTLQELQFMNSVQNASNPLVIENIDQVPEEYQHLYTLLHKLKRKIRTKYPKRTKNTQNTQATRNIHDLLYWNYIIQMIYILDGRRPGITKPPHPDSIFKPTTISKYSHECKTFFDKNRKFQAKDQVLDYDINNDYMEILLVAGSHDTPTLNPQSNGGILSNKIVQNIQKNSNAHERLLDRLNNSVAQQLKQVR